MRRPESPELRQPLLHLLERLPPQPVQSPLRVHRGFHKPRLPQHPQMFRHRRLCHPQPTLNLSHRTFRRTQQTHNRPPVRLRNHLKNVFHPPYIPYIAYTCQGIYKTTNLDGFFEPLTKRVSLERFCQPSPTEASALAHPSTGKEIIGGNKQPNTRNNRDRSGRVNRTGQSAPNGHYPN